MPTSPIIEVGLSTASCHTVCSRLSVGKTQIHRLQHIGAASTQLYLEALKSAIAAAKMGKDVELYQAVTKTLYQIVPDDPDATLDSTWIAKTRAEVNKETARLEAEFKGYRNNLIKESIRVRMPCFYNPID